MQAITSGRAPVASPAHDPHSRTVAPPAPWRFDEVATYLKEGVPPANAAGDVASAKATFESLARHECPGQDAGLDRFLARLGAARSHEDLLPLVRDHFACFGQGVRFLPPLLAPLQGRDLLPTPMRPVANYEAFLGASGMQLHEFNRLCGELSPRVPFFADVFMQSAHVGWGTVFFSELGKALRACAPGEAVTVVMYHRDCYGVRRDRNTGAELPGSGLSHNSVMAITPRGEVCLNHHESIPLGTGIAPVRSLMPGTLGLVCGSHDTSALHERVAEVFGQPVPAELPVQQSFRLHGGPPCTMGRIRSFEAFRRHTEELQQRSCGAQGMSMLYAADPDPQLRTASEAELRSHPRARAQPSVPPPGEGLRKSARDYSNNCLLTTLLAMAAGGEERLRPFAHLISASTDLLTLFEVLYLSGFMPDTDAALLHKARAERASNGLTTRSFLMIGGYAAQPGRGYAPTVGAEAGMPRSAM